jgi:hypothetical protein
MSSKSYSDTVSYLDWLHVRVVMVVCKDYDKFGNCTPTRVGPCGWKPPNQVMDDMEKKLRKYGFG